MAGLGAAEWAKEAKVLIDSPGEPGHFLPSACLSTLIPLQALWILTTSLLPFFKANIYQLFMPLRPWVEDKAVFPGFFIVRGSIVNKMLAVLGKETGELILNSF